MVNKRRHIAFLLLAVIAAAALFSTVYASCRLTENINDVSLKIVDSRGDVKAAEGMDISFNTAFESSKVWWSHELKVKGGKLQLDSQERIGRDIPQYLSGGSGSTRKVNLTFDVGNSKQVKKYMEEIAASMNKGETVTKTVEIRVLFDNYPVSYSWYIDEAGSCFIYSDDDASVLAGLKEALDKVFRFPVESGETVSISVTKEGSSYSGGVSSDKYMMLTGIFTGSDIFFAIYGDSGLRAQDGPGIYRLPVKKLDSPVRQNGLTISYWPDSDRLIKYCDLPEGISRYISGGTADGKAFITVYDDGAELTAVIARSGGVEAQVLHLGPADDLGYQFYFRDDYVVCRNGLVGYYCIYPDGDKYAARFFPTEKWHSSNSERIMTSAAFDGRRLMTVWRYQSYSFDEWTGYHYSSSQLFVEVCTENGLQYSAIYVTDLMDVGGVEGPSYGSNMTELRPYINLNLSDAKWN